jgi:hypothetical protein
MNTNTLETNYPCFSSVNSVQGFFKSSTIGVNEKLYQITDKIFRCFRRIAGTPIRAAPRGTTN